MTATENQSQKQKRLSTELIDNFAQLITSGFGLVAALAWNEAIQTLFNQIFPKEEIGGVIAKTLYAALITILIVVIIYQMGKISNRVKKGIERKGARR